GVSGGEVCRADVSSPVHGDCNSSDTSGTHVDHEHHQYGVSGRCELCQQDFGDIAEDEDEDVSLDESDHDDRDDLTPSEEDELNGYLQREPELANAPAGQFGASAEPVGKSSRVYIDPHRRHHRPVIPSPV